MKKKLGSNFNGGSVYLNLIGGGSGIYDKYSPAEISQIISMLNDAGIQKVVLAFAQIGGLAAMMSGQGPFSTCDTLGQMLNEAGSAWIVKNIVNPFKNAGIQVGLSFGRSSVSPADMTIGDGKTTASAIQAAKNLVSLCNTLSIDFVDFDIEKSDDFVGNYLMTQNLPAVIQTFFTQVVQLIGTKKTWLTTNGYLPYSAGWVNYQKVWVPGPLSPLFYSNPNDPTSESIFSTYFTGGLNIMAYGGNTDPVTLCSHSNSQGLDAILALVGGDASKVSLGFYDQVDYNKVAYSCPPSPAIPTTNSQGKPMTSGQAAAFVYIQVLNNLGLKPTDMGMPFFWTDTPSTLGGADWFPSDFNAYLQNNL